MKIINLYSLIANTKEYSSFIQINYNHHSNTIAYKAMHEQQWKAFNKENFISPEFELSKSDSGKKNYQFDISSSASPFYILSEKAIEALKDILEPRGQFLPINTASKKKKFVGYYPTNVIRNALDIEKSGMKDYNYEVLGIKKNNLVFKEGTTLDDYLFSLSEDRRYVFVTEKFRQRVEEAGLKGFDFNKRNVQVKVR